MKTLSSGTHITGKREKTNDMAKRNVFPLYSSIEQTVHINELLGAQEPYYTLNDVMRLLPQDITYNGTRGYLYVSAITLSYTSLNAEYKVNVVRSESLMSNKDIYDGFIGMLNFLESNKDKIIINE